MKQTIQRRDTGFQPVRGRALPAPERRAILAQDGPLPPGLKRRTTHRLEAGVTLRLASVVVAFLFSLLSALPAQAQYQLDAGAFNDMTPVSPRGLNAQYFNNTTLTPPVASERLEGPLNFNYSATDFSARWTGFIRIPATGAYTFYVASDDGVRLWIDDVNGAPAVDQWVPRPETENATGSFNFSADQQVPVKIEYYQAGGGAALRLRWEGPGIAKAIVPSANLIPPGGLVEPTGLPVTHPAIPGQTAGPSVQSAGATSSTTSAVGTAGPYTAKFPSAVYRDGAGQPTGSAIVLEQSQFGFAFSSGVPRYYMGDFILPPVAQANGITPAGATYWRDQPVAPGEVINHTSGGPETPLPANVRLSYYYSPHAHRVFASQPGNVTLKWVSRAPAGNGRYQFRDETFSVSASTRLPVRPLYWTERAFSAPAISVPTGRIQVVNPVYTPFFPALVAAEYRVPGTTEGAIDELPEEKRTVWFDINGQNRRLHAYNHEGRILVEYLGALRSDGLTYEFLGADVVDVAQVPVEKVVTVKLGEEILPQDGNLTWDLSFGAFKSGAKAARRSTLALAAVTSF